MALAFRFEPAEVKNWKPNASLPFTPSVLSVIGGTVITAAKGVHVVLRVTVVGEKNTSGEPPPPLPKLWSPSIHMFPAPDDRLAQPSTVIVWPA